MNNDALKAAALEAAKKLWDSARHIGMARDIIVVFLQPLVDADRQETERLKKALREIRDVQSGPDLKCKDATMVARERRGIAMIALGEW